MASSSSSWSHLHRDDGDPPSLSMFVLLWFVLHTEGVFQSMVAASSVLNAPNCSLPCTGPTINRATCEVAEMCGECADGFVGMLGPSNEPCYVAGEHCDNGVLDWNETDTDCGGPCAPCEAAGAACAFDTDCLYAWCTVLGVCAVPVKTCPGSNCTFGQGVCSHVDVTGAQLAARDCLANDWACSAVCTCRERFEVNGSAAGMWYGDDCSLDEVGFAEVVALRNLLLGSLGSASGMQARRVSARLFSHASCPSDVRGVLVTLPRQIARTCADMTDPSHVQDVTIESLNQQASCLSSLSAVPSQLAGGGEVQALGLVGGIASGSEGTGLAGGTGDTVGMTISSLLSTSCGLLAANVTFKATVQFSPTAAPSAAGTSANAIDAPTSAPTVAQRRWRHMRRGRRTVLEEVEEEVADDGGSPTFAPTAALADGAALTAVANAIGSLSAAQLGGAVAGEVNKTNDDVAIFRRRGMARISLKVSRDARKRGGGKTNMASTPDA